MSETAANSEQSTSIGRAVDCVDFCVIDRPFAVWSWDIIAESRAFLEGVDHNFYLRIAKKILSDENLIFDDNAELGMNEIKSRKDIAAISRLLRHHGIETLIMLWGALLQAPHAPHAYFLKCKTEDTRALARLFIRDECPKFLRTKNSSLKFMDIVNGIHARTPYCDDDVYLQRLGKVARSLIASAADDDDRDEFNSLKHGLRTRHGGFQLQVGVEDTPGVPANESDMVVLGASNDASWFNVARPLLNATNVESRVNFEIGHTTLPWSLAKTICDLQLLSILIGNTVSTLLIGCGAPPSTVQFHRLVDAEEWWERYETMGHTGIMRWSMANNIDAGVVHVRSAEDVIDSYSEQRRRAG